MKIFLKSTNPLSEVYLRYSDILDKSKKYDCIISTEDVTSDILAEHERILLIERLDGAAIWCRRLLKHPHVKTLLKMYHYPDLEINNAPAVNARIFVPPDGTEKPQEPELSAEDLAKVRPGFSFFHYSRINAAIDYARANKTIPFHKRELDWYFAGTTIYGQHSREPSACGDWITRHRQSVIEKLDREGEKGASVISAGTRAWNNGQYLRLTANTRYILSPFGWGEYCYRDYEALVLGCVVIKPMTRRITSLPCVDSLIDWTSSFPEPAGDLPQARDSEGVSRWVVEQKDNERKIIEEILQ